MVTSLFTLLERRTQTWQERLTQIWQERLTEVQQSFQQLQEGVQQAHTRNLEAAQSLVRGLDWLNRR